MRGRSVTGNGHLARSDKARHTRWKLGDGWWCFGRLGQSVSHWVGLRSGANYRVPEAERLARHARQVRNSGARPCKQQQVARGRKERQVPTCGARAYSTTFCPSVMHKVIQRPPVHMIQQSARGGTCWRFGAFRFVSFHHEGFARVSHREVQPDTTSNIVDTVLLCPSLTGGRFIAGLYCVRPSVNRQETCCPRRWMDQEREAERSRSVPRHIRWLLQGPSSSCC
jgi:hypothetical protein